MIVVEALSGRAHDLFWQAAASRPRAGGWRPVAEALGAAFAAVVLIAMVADSCTMPRDTDQGGEGAGAGRQWAPEDGIPAWAPGREWTVGAYLGSPYTYDSDVKFSGSAKHDATVKGVEWFGQPFKNPLYYGVRVSRWFEGGRTGAMLDFTHSKAISRRDQEARFEGTLDGKPAPEKALIGDIFKKLEASHGHNMLTLNGLVRLPSFSWRLSPYVGLGAGVNLPHSEIHIATDPTRTYEYQMTGPVGQALVGVEVRLARTSYFLEYKFSLADYWMPLSGRDGYVLPYDLWLQFQDWWTGTPPRDGWASTRLTSHQAIGGISVRVTAP